MAGILGLAWRLLRDASGSPMLASLGTSLFAALSAYRLFQLRPHLMTMLGVLLLLRLVILARGVPSWKRVAGVAGLFGLWANLHGGFVLGLALLGAATAAEVALGLVEPARRPRAVRSVALAGLAGLATLANPMGARTHLLYLAAGEETPALEVVADEWARVALFELPVANVPPSLLTWLALWAVAVVVPFAGLRLLRARRDDLPLLAVAAVSLAGMLAAVRLSWLAIAPLLVLGRGLSSARLPASPGVAWAVALTTLGLVPAFVSVGAWPMISRGVHRLTYAQPYAVAKVDAHAVWLLRDAGLEGNLFNDYVTGNFLGYWLAPRMRVFVNGSLNVPPQVMETLYAVQTGRLAGRSLTERLDRYDVDVFFGTGLPVAPASARWEPSTTTRLEHAPGWIPVFRNLRSSLHLRDDERNRENLGRVTAYYARQGVPFDPERGFEPARVIQKAPRWAIRHGLVPAGFPSLEAALGTLHPTRRAVAQERVAELHALLGDYERALAIDDQRLRRDPDALGAQRRRLWCLLHLRRAADGLEAAAELEAAAPPGDALSALLISAARRHAELGEEEGAALVTQLPLLGPAGEGRALAGVLAGEIRHPENRLVPTHPGTN